MAEVILEKGAGVYILTPNKAFISVISHDNNENASFELQGSINRRVAEDLTEEDKELEIEFVYNLKPVDVEITQDPLQNKLMLIFLISVLVLMCIVFAIYLLYRNFK